MKRMLILVLVGVALVPSLVEAKRFDVSTGNQLKQAVSEAQPGDEIVVANGTYSGDLTFSRSGTENSPIILRAQNQGMAILRNSKIRIPSNYIEVRGFVFEGDGIDITSGKHNKISRNLFRSIQGGPAVSLQKNASYNRINHNEITSSGGGILLNNPEPGMTGNRIDHNYIHANADDTRADEAIRLGLRNSTFYNLNTLVEYNLIEDIATDRKSGGEIISVKSSGNVIVRNTLKNSADRVLTLRHGTNNLVQNNTLENIRITAFGEDGNIIGNKLTGEGIYISAGTCLQEEVLTGDGCFPAAKGWLVESNVITGDSIRVGTGNSARTIPAENNVLACNTGTVSKQNELRTTITQTCTRSNSENGSAVLVTKNMVGPNGTHDGTSHDIDHAAPDPGDGGVIGTSPITVFPEERGCHTYKNSSYNVPTSFGAAYNTQSASKEILLTAMCTDTTTTITAGSSKSSIITWKSIYAWDGASWKSHSLACTPYAGNAAWCAGSGSVSLPKNTAWFAAFTCHLNGSSWKCGCTDSTCANPKWQLQGIE